MGAKCGNINVIIPSGFQNSRSSRNLDPLAVNCQCHLNHGAISSSIDCLIRSIQCVRIASMVWQNWDSIRRIHFPSNAIPPTLGKPETFQENVIPQFRMGSTFFFPFLSGKGHNQRVLRRQLRQSGYPTLSLSPPGQSTASTCQSRRGSWPCRR